MPIYIIHHKPPKIEGHISLRIASEGYIKLKPGTRQKNGGWDITYLNYINIGSEPNNFDDVSQTIDRIIERHVIAYFTKRGIECSQNYPEDGLSFASEECGGLSLQINGPLNKNGKRVLYMQTVCPFKCDNLLNDHKFLRGPITLEEAMEMFSNLNQN